MKAHLQSRLRAALSSLEASGELPAAPFAEPPVEYARDPAHGDFGSPVAMAMARPAQRSPRDIAAAIVAALPADPLVAEVSIAGPGFINFRLADSAWAELVTRVLRDGKQYGRGTAGAGATLQVEFVSANPTGPLHVGHGRGAVFGATLANVLEAAGFTVQREYYVNDAGRQMDILATSTWLRYLDSDAIVFPRQGYRGDYVTEMSAALREAHGDRFERDVAALAADLPDDAVDEKATDTADQRASNKGCAEAYIDALVARAKAQLGAVDYQAVFDFALQAQRRDIRDDLAALGIEFDRFFSEASLTTDGQVDAAIARLESSGHAYRRDGALWLAATALGDEKDRVIERSDGRRTYFASDLAYLVDKFERGFDPAIYVLGADHHGYIARLRAAATALGYEAARVEVLLTQLAALYRGGELVQMSTRAGEFFTLAELTGEIGRDAVRFFYIQRKNDQRLDFDIELAKSKQNENPVYYVQYAHARIASVLREAKARGIDVNAAACDAAGLEALDSERARSLQRCIERYPGVIESAALAREPHLIAFYLRELATELHSFYAEHKILHDDSATALRHLLMVRAAQVVIANGLTVLGVSAPQRM